VMKANVSLLIAIIIVTGSCALYMLRSSTVVSSIKPLNTNDAFSVSPTIQFRLSTLMDVPPPVIDHRVVTEHSVDIVYTYVNRSQTRGLEAMFQKRRRQ
jgi:hypothetical protein